MNIGLIGWNGKLNVGDDAMTSVIISHLKKMNSESTFYVLADQKDLAIYTSEKNESNWVKGYAFINSLMKLKGASIIRHYLFPLIFSKNKDAVVLGGGSIIHREGNSKRLIKLLSSLRKKNKDIKIGAVGISIGPFKNRLQHELAHKVLNLLDFVVVRDDRSFQLINEFELPYKPVKAPDLAFLLPSIREDDLGNNIKRDNKTLGISLRIGYCTDDYLDKISKSTHLLFEKYGFEKIKIFNFCDLDGQKDSIPSARFIKKLGEEFSSKISIIDFDKNPLSFYEQISSCGLMICMRLHASILSFAMETPFLILPYHQKCIDFGKQIAGLSDEYFLYDDELEEEIDKKLKFIINAKEQFYKREQVITEARQNLEALNLVLK